MDGGVRTVQMLHRNDFGPMRAKKDLVVAGAVTGERNADIADVIHVSE